MSNQAPTAIQPDRRQAILAAALACFTDSGFAATSIDGIRARSGASTGSIYHHFSSKEGIAAALYEEGLADYRQHLSAAIAGAADDPESLIRAIVLAHLAWAEGHPDWAHYLMAMRRAAPVIAIEGSIRRSSSMFLRDTFARLQPHIDAGRIVQMPIALYAAQIIGPAQEFLRLWLTGRTSLTPSDAGAALADAAWRAVRAD